MHFRVLVGLAFANLVTTSCYKGTRRQNAQTGDVDTPRVRTVCWRHHKLTTTEKKNCWSVAWTQYDPPSNQSINQTIVHVPWISDVVPWGRIFTASASVSTCSVYVTTLPWIRLSIPQR